VTNTSARSRLLLLALSVLVLGAATPPASGAGPVDRRLVAPGLAEDEGWDPSGETGCRPGHAVCLENLIREMERHYADVGCDHHAVFALLYLRTTEGIRDAVVDGFFDEPHLLAHQGYVFGRYYLDPFRAWEQGRDERVPEAWRIAFEAGEAKQVSVVGNMMLGINAHVNRDLPFVLAAIGDTASDGTSRKDDHDRVNTVLEATRPVAVPQIADELDPSIYAAFAAPQSENQVPAWREQAWQNAQRLLRAETDAERAVIAEEIEDTAAWIAQQFVEAFPLDGEARDARDRHCAAARG
jgi:hypothetical protein